MNLLKYLIVIILSAKLFWVHMRQALPIHLRLPLNSLCSLGCLPMVVSQVSELLRE